MNVFMTNGTVDFLRTIIEKNPNHNLFLMNNSETALLYEETENPTKLQEARKYEVVDAKGTVKQDGYVVMNNIPVTTEGRPIFEDMFKNRQGKVEDMPGFQAIRILRPTTGNTYIVFTQWQDAQSFQAWKDSQSFEKAHQKGKENKRPPFAAGPSYTTQYFMTELD